MLSYLKQFLACPLCLMILITIEFLLTQLFYEFAPRLDIICIIILSISSPFILFALGIMKDIINAQVVGVTSLLYLLLSIFRYYYKSQIIPTLVLIFSAEWIINTMFFEYTQPITSLIINFSVTLTSYLLFRAIFSNVYFQR